MESNDALTADLQVEFRLIMSNYKNLNSQFEDNVLNFISLVNDHQPLLIKMIAANSAVGASPSVEFELFDFIDDSLTADLKRKLQLITTNI